MKTKMVRETELPKKDAAQKALDEAETLQFVVPDSQIYLELIVNLR